MLLICFSNHGPELNLIILTMIVLHRIGANQLHNKLPGVIEHGVDFQFVDRIPTDTGHRVTVVATVCQTEPW